MATRKEARKKSLLQLLALIIAVAVIVVSVVLFQNWWNSRPGPEPKDVKIKASVGDQSLEVAPYMVCEIGTGCPEGETPTSPSVKTTPFTWRSPKRSQQTSGAF